LARDLYPTSRKLVDLAHQFGIDAGRSTTRSSDTRALANVVLALDGARRSRARTTALVNVLDHLGIALALSEPGGIRSGARMFAGITRAFSLGRYSTCLEAYERAGRLTSRFRPSMK
jgi:hypothetical protein